jgi:Glycosyltransferase family 87
VIAVLGALLLPNDGFLTVGLPHPSPMGEQRKPRLSDGILALLSDKTAILRDAGSISVGAPETGFFTEARLGLGATIVILSYALGVAIRLYRHQWIAHPINSPCADFIWIWLSSKFAILGTLAQAYDYSMLSAARAAITGLPNCILEHFDYPPTLLFFTYPLGFLPYPIAFAAWITATLAVYLAAVHAIVPRSLAVIAALTPFPVLFNVLMGHNGFLTAGLVGLGLVSMERRPWLSGIFIGLLSCKPQLGILFPFTLLAARNWRALLGATATCALFAAAAALAFGYETWPAFAGALEDRAVQLSDAPQQAFAFAMISIFGVLQTLKVPAALSWVAQLAVSAAVVATVWALWARRIPYSLKAAALAAGALLASPHAHGYDACILTIAVAFLVEDGLARGFLPRERGTILGCWLALFLLTGPVPAIVCVVLLIRVVQRVLQFREGAAATPSMAETGGAGS